MQKKLISLVGIVFLLLLSPILNSSSEGADISTTTCPGAGCVTYNTNNNGSVAIQITGTWVGTITFQSTVDNSTYTSFRVVSIADTSALGVITTTANGIFNGTVTGVSQVRVVFTAYTSGTAVVSFRGVNQAAKFNLPVTNSGTVTSIATTSPITGGTITSTGTIACATCVVGPASVTDNHLAVFDGTTGKLIKDGGAIPAGTIGGSIANTQIAVGTGVNTIGGSAVLTYGSDITTSLGRLILTEQVFDYSGAAYGNLYVNTSPLDADNNAVIGIYSTANTTGTQTHNLSDIIAADLAAFGAVPVGKTLLSVFGTRSNATASGAGSVDYLSGWYGGFDATDVTTTVNHAYGVLISNSGGASIATAAALRIEDMAGIGTISQAINYADKFIVDSRGAIVQSAETTTAGDFNGIEADLYTSGSANSGRLSAFYTYVRPTSSGTVSQIASIYIDAPEPVGGAVTDVFGLKIIDQSSIVVSGVNQAINYANKFIVDSAGAITSTALAGTKLPVCETNGVFYAGTNTAGVLACP